MFFESIVEWFIYSHLAMVNIMAQFFESQNFTPVQIGALMAVIPTVSLLSNPFWFSLKRKIGEKRVFAAITLSAALLCWSVYLVPGFLPKFIALIIFGFFSTGVIPIGESQVMNSLMKKGLHFDRARLIGTVGFSAISLVSGFLFEISFAFMFIISTIALLIALVFSIKLTDTEFIVEKSHKTDESGTSRTLTFLLIAATLGIMCVSFCGTFLPVLVTEKGFPENTVGICFAILSISEVPFLLFANRIIQKTGTIFLVATAILMMSIRLFLTPLAQTPVQLMLTNVFHGWNYIVIYFSIFNFIHYKMPSHKLDKSQTIFWMITQGVSFLIGNLGGGILVQYLGLTESYRLLSLLMFILFIPLFIWFLSDKNKKAIRV
ncbi:MAG TPA: MFS transporter [Thermotogota bacterium]|nr:MFS transporter [Thermotogota bacterium]